MNFFASLIILQPIFGGFLINGMPTMETLHEISDGDMNSTVPETALSQHSTNEDTALNKRVNVGGFWIECDFIDKNRGRRFFQTEQSYCRRPQNVRDWACVARHTPADGNPGEGPSKFFQGTCPENHICVDGVARAEGGVRAKCVPTESIMKGAMTLQQLQASKQTISVPKDASHEPGEEKTMEAIFSYADDLDRSITVSSIDILDQAAQVSNPPDPWTTVAENHCTSCTSLGIQPVPDTTARWLVSAGLPAGTGDVTVWFAFL